MMEFQKPVVVYTAATNLEAHMIVEMLRANGVPAHAVEDQSGVSLWAFGTISQFHQPNIWVDQAAAMRAAELIREYEEKQRRRRRPANGPGDVRAVCEDCGQVSMFPAALDGTVQDCAHCGAYVDVGELPWAEDNDGVAEEPGEGGEPPS